MKKFFALVLAIMMVMSLALPAAADDTTTYTLTINNDVAGHTYEAYQIFKGTLSADGTTLSDVEWGDSIANGQGDALLSAILNDKKELLTTVGTTTLQAVFASAAAMDGTKAQFDKMVELLGTVSNDSYTLDRFAEIVGNAVYDADDKFVKHTYLDDPIDTDAYTDDNKYELNLPAGYYLIKDKEGTQNGVEGGYYTKYIVRVIKEGNVNPKGSGVIVDKTINDTLDGTFDNVEDFDVNDDVYYKLSGSLPTNLRAYDKYWYKFTDTLPASVTFVEIEQIYVENHNGHAVHVFYDVNDTAKNTLPYDNNGTTDDKTDDIFIKTSTGTSEGKVTVMVEFSDLLKLYPSLLSTDKIVVKYSCYLNRDALIAQPNTNKVYLEYDNNPNGEGRGETVDDVAHAFTFEFTVDKYDMADSTKKLAGVEFLLYYRTVNDAEEIVNMYAKVVTEEMIAANAVINGKAVDNDDLGLIYGWTNVRDDASVLDTDTNGKIHVKGLDEGTYFLEETKTVDGYNLLDTPVQIDIIPTYTENGQEASVEVEYKVDSISQGTNGTVGVRNSKGSTLPSTGGMGTTLFYVLGSVLVMGALVMLITKKRMAAEN